MAPLVLVFSLLLVMAIQDEAVHAKKSGRRCKVKPSTKVDIFDDDDYRRSIFIGDSIGSIPAQLKVTNLSVTACPSKENYPLQGDLKVLGETLLPGYVNLAYDITSKIDISEDIVVKVEASKIILGDRVLLPCINNLGSCTYTKKCNPQGEPCSGKLINGKIPCTCPTPKGHYQTDDLKFYIGITEITDIPGWLTDGHYTAEINILTGDQKLVCLNIEMDIKKLS